jgi:hypothetical protein
MHVAQAALAPPVGQARLDLRDGDTRPHSERRFCERHQARERALKFLRGQREVLRHTPVEQRARNVLAIQLALCALELDQDHALDPS